MFDEGLSLLRQSPMSSNGHSPATTTSPSYHSAFVLDQIEISPHTEGSVQIHTHKALGLQVLVHRVEDPIKTLCLLFGTPHNSANGLPHILEHLVFAGSKKFPVTYPFFATIKGAFSTYLNASTGQETTIYMAATTSGSELLNLSDINLNGVFHPCLTDTAFAREGWRLDQDTSGRWKFSGVVYSEMKGAYSDDPTRVLFRAACEALYPDTHRGHDSSGDPFHIPTLTRDELVRYHRTRAEIDWQSVANDLNELRAACVALEHARTGLYCGADRRDAHAAILATLWNRLPDAIKVSPDAPSGFTKGAELLGLSINSDVAHIGSALQLQIDPKSDLVGALHVLSRAIAHNYLHHPTWQAHEQPVRSL